MLALAIILDDQFFLLRHMNKYCERLTFNFQIDGGLTLPVNVTKKCAAECTSKFLLVPTPPSLSTGDTATMIRDINSLHSAS